jgi:hypothetical protein
MLAVSPAGTAAQRHISCGNSGDQTAKQARAGGARKSHIVSSLEASPIRHPTLGILQFLIKLLLIQLRSNSFFAVSEHNTFSSRDYLFVFSFWQGCVCLPPPFIHSFIYSFIGAGCTESRSFPTHSLRVTDHISKLGPDQFCVTRV